MNPKMKWIAAGLGIGILGGLVWMSRWASRMQPIDNSSQGTSGYGVDATMLAPGTLTENSEEKKTPSTTKGEVSGTRGGVGGIPPLVAAPSLSLPSAGLSAQTPAVVVPAPVPKEPTCAKFAFASKTPKQRYEKNQIHLPDALREAKMNWESLCVRADGVPVKHELDRKSLEISLGTLRRADSKVVVSVCETGAKCSSDSCVVPRDEFMEALAGEEEHDDEGGTGWAPQAGLANAMVSNEEKELDKELATFSKVLNEEKTKGVNSAWNIEQRGEGCEAQFAKNR